MEKNEIKSLVEKYKISIDCSFSNDEEFKNIISKIKLFNNSERPDAQYAIGEYCYGIEHFQVSQYTNKKGDISKKALGSKIHRDKISRDMEYKYFPSIENLIKSIKSSLESHSKSFEIYKSNTCENYPGKKFRLIIFIEDSTESAYIVSKNSEIYKPINPLLLKEIAELLVAYKNIYGIIYSYGNEVEKRITGCTLYELTHKIENGDVELIENYKPFEDRRNVKVALDEENDKNSVTITLFDRI